MKLSVNGTEYGIADSLQGSTLGDLMKLKVKTKTDDFPGVTVKFIQSMFTDIGVQMQDETFDPIDLLGDENFLHAIGGLIYLARRNAGETLEPSDALDTKFDAFTFVDDEADADPKELGVEGVNESLMTPTI